MATIVNGSTGVSQVQETVTLKVISTGSVPSLEAKGTSGVTSGYLELKCSENTHGIKLLGPPHSAGADYTLTFPNNDGDAGQFLQSNGSGVMSWAAAGGGLTQLFTIDMNASPANTYNTGALNLSTFKYLFFSGDNIHLTLDTGGGLGLTPNGSSLINFTAGTGPSNALWFNSFFDLTRHYGAGSHISTTKDLTTIGSTGSTSSFVHNGLTTSTTSIEFSNPAGTNFIGGNLTLYGLS